MRKRVEVFLLSCAIIFALVVVFGYAIAHPNVSAESGEKLRSNTPVYVQVDQAPTSPFLLPAAHDSALKSVVLSTVAKRYAHTCIQCRSCDSSTLDYSLLNMSSYLESGIDPTYPRTETRSATGTYRAPAFAVLASSRSGYFRTLAKLND